MDNTKEDVDKYYSENYNKLINYVINRKRGGDRVNLPPDEAVEVVHDTYIYHATHPWSFDPRYILNIIKQRRLNYLRDKANYNSLKQSFFEHFYGGGEKPCVESTVEDDISKSQMYAIVKFEISQISYQKSKDIIYRTLILGDKGNKPKTQAERKALSRFTAKLVEKYGWEYERE